MICPTTGKITYRKRSGAHRAGKELERKSRNARPAARKQTRNVEIVEYRCEHCGGWHVANRYGNVRPTAWHRT